MSLFGTKKKIYVSSVIYNMAGDIEDRPNYMKSSVTSSVVLGSNSIADDLKSSYMKGPGIRLRSFYRWSKIEANYDTIGTPDSYVSGSIDLDISSLAPELPHGTGETPVVQKAEAGPSDYGFWAEQWLLENNPSVIDTEWRADFIDATGDILITYEDTTYDTFTPAGYAKDGLYIYAYYTSYTGEEEGSLVTGETVVLDSGDSFPDHTDYTATDTITDVVDVTLTTTVDTIVTYSDSTPDETSSDSSDEASNYNVIHSSFTKDEYIGGGSSSSRLYSFLEEYTDAHIEAVVTEEVTEEDIGGGVTKTTTVTTTTDTIIVDRSYRIDTRTDVLKAWTPLTLYIYRLGSGNPTLDAMISYADGTGEYFPYIPVRIDNQYITEVGNADAAEQVTKAYKKLTGAKLSDLIDQLDDNPDIGDIDFAYVSFGAVLNVEDKTTRKYLYNYFSKLMQSQTADTTDYDAWDALIDIYTTAQNNWKDWKEAQENSSDPLFGTTEPTVPAYPSKPTNTVRINSQGDLTTNYDMEISWQAIAEITGSGLKKPDAKKGDLWWDTSVPDNVKEYPVFMQDIFVNTGSTINTVILNYQVSETEWKALTIIGMIHRNYIYQGKYVEIMANEAVVDTEPSGFFVPLHYPTMTEMSLADYTQIAVSCTYMVLNCYQVVKQKWYETGWFKVILIIAIIVISVYTGGGALGGFGGGLGASTATSLGLTGVTAAIVTVAVNVVVATLITKAVSYASIQIFGKQVGAIVAVVASFLTMAGINSIGSGQSFQQAISASWSELMKADNLLNLTNSIGNAYAQSIQAGVAKTYAATEKLQEDYEKQSAEISKLYAENIGYDKGTIDPLMFTDNFSFVYEDPSTFLSRTLLTGSDISALSLTMLDNFADLTLSTELPI